jgi:hypothetical protein
MPGFDKSGPVGDGPLSGAGRGFCRAADKDYRGVIPGRAGFGRGLGYGFRGGRGFNRTRTRGFGREFSGNQSLSFASATGDMGSKLNMLKAETESMKSALDAINQRIDGLENSSGKREA